MNIRKCWGFFVKVPSSPKYLVIILLDNLLRLLLGHRSYNKPIKYTHQSWSCAWFISTLLLFSQKSLRIYRKGCFPKQKNISVAKHIKGARFTFFLRKINGNGPLWNIRIAYQKIILSCFPLWIYLKIC